MISNTTNHKAPPLQESKQLSNSKKNFIARIPKRPIILVGKFLGVLVYFLDARHRRIVRRNLKFTHPEWTAKHIRNLNKNVFKNMGITFLEICQMGFLSRDDILGKVQVKGEETLSKAMEGSQGSILISAHLGNWELAVLFGSCYLSKPLVGVAKEIQSKII